MEAIDIYNSIHEFLVNNDWSCSKEEDSMMKYSKQFIKGQKTVTIINGQVTNSEPNIYNIILSFIGFGDIEGAPIVGYNVCINDDLEYTVYVDSLEDFKKEIYEKL